MYSSTFFSKLNKCPLLLDDLHEKCTMKSCRIILIWSALLIYSISHLYNIFMFNRSRGNQLVALQIDSKLISVVCQMGDFGSGDGGWTPVVKIDGRKVFFVFT